jgi:pimeloyl-ACP methyl ester carboxylesterase
MEHQNIASNGIRLHVVEEGPVEGPLLILLHGFPEFWYGWWKQIPYFAATGYRVWAPDQRGYNLSDKPRGIAAYNLDALAADVVGLIDAAGREKAFLVGHDWGGAAAWWVAAKYPQRLEKLVVLNAPYGAVLTKSLRQNPAQRRKSWYMFFFQLPWLPEVVSRRQNWRLLTGMLRSSSLPGTFTDADIAEYRRAWSQPGAYVGMLSWYRAMMRTQPASLPRQPIGVPTLLLWGAQDQFLGRDLAEASIKRCSQGQLLFLEDATHWLHHEQPERVNGLIQEFLSKPAASSPNSTR